MLPDLNLATAESAPDRNFCRRLEAAEAADDDDGLVLLLATEDAAERRFLAEAAKAIEEED